MTHDHRRRRLSLDRTNHRLLRLFHAAYIDRPRAQLDFYPVGSAPMVYALADRGARLMIERDGIEFANVEWSRKNRSATAPAVFRGSARQQIARTGGLAQA